MILNAMRKAMPPLAAAGRAVERLRDWMRQDDGSWRDGAPRPFLVFLLVFGVGIVLVSLLGDQGLVAYQGLRREEAALRRDIADLEREAGDLARDVEALRSDPDYVEMLARQRLGLVKPGETIIEIHVRPAERR